MNRLRSTVAALALLASTPALADDPTFPKPVEDAFAAARTSMLADPATALRHVVEAETAARGLPDGREHILILATARWLAGETYLRSNQAEKGGKLLAEGLRLIDPIQEPIKLRGNLLMSQGVYFRKLDRVGEALANFTRAHKIFVAVNEPSRQAVALQNIALLYHDANDDQRAERYYQQAAAAYNGDPSMSLSLHNNRGNALLSLNRYREAENEFLQALSLARASDNPVMEARVLGNLGRSQIDLEHFDVADRTITRAFALIANEDQPMLRRQLFATAARLAADRGDYPKAARLIRECFDGIDLSTTTGDFRNAHLYAHEIFSRIGEDRLALEHLEALKRLNDEATKVATTTSAALMAAQFDYQGQQLEIQKQQLKAAEFANWLYAAIGIASLLVTALLAWGLVIMRRSRNKVRAANIVLGETNVALEKALAAKSEFLATTSHEIRTPLNGILGMTQVMLSDPKLEAKTRDRIGIVHSAGVTMRTLVDDILDVAKMEKGAMTVEAAPLDLRAMLENVTRLWREQAAGKGLEFHLELGDAPGWIVGDSERLRQIVFNLLSNAIKFTEKGGVTLRAATQGDRLTLAIVDTGIGIPADKFDDIFESFRQVDTSTTRRFGGTGLGLTICRNLAQALGGDISVTSVEGQGSTFVIDLPLVLAEAPQAAEAGGGANLVVLDRNPIARSVLKTLLEPRVAMLRFAGSADEALKMLEEGGVTRLLADEMTLKADPEGPMDTLRKLSAAASELCVTVLWLKPDDDVKSQLQAAGAGQIVEKPVAGPALIEALVPESKENFVQTEADALVSRAA
jgi:signal transduction histidine kinase